MAVFRSTPYENRRFQVDISGITGSGFSEVILPAMGVDVVEFREGNDPTASVRKLPGATHFGNLILKRGFKGSLELYQWWLEASTGNSSTRRNISVILLSEDASQSVATWQFSDAFPTKYSVSELNARGCDVLIETIEIVSDNVQLI
ncbi:MAG: phage tail protein [Bacteroidota bacterium]|nr:phage tail protein [Bacteroidota bacterium]